MTTEIEWKCILQYLTGYLMPSSSEQCSFLWILCAVNAFLGSDADGAACPVVADRDLGFQGIRPPVNSCITRNLRL